MVVGEILENAPHPQAEKLSVTQVTIGAQRLQIVCGARGTTRRGDHVPVARVGAELPGGKVIEATRIRGVASEGMLCSQRELGLGEGNEGLWILPRTLPLGGSLSEALSLKDWILEINVTPNRADCLSQLGLARELAALQGWEAPSTAANSATSVEGAGDGAGTLTAPRLEATDRCGLYLGQPLKVQEGLATSLVASHPFLGSGGWRSAACDPSTWRWTSPTTSCSSWASIPPCFRSR